MVAIRSNQLIRRAAAPIFGHMGFRAAFLCLPIVLAGCDSLSLYHKAGVSVQRMQSDEIGCEVKALRDAPVRTVVRRTPATWIPARKICDSAGNCHTRGGYWEPGQIYTEDVNRDLRRRVEGLCMARLGYRPVTLPACSQAVRRAAPPGATTRLPRISERSCVIRDRQAGTWQIVTPVLPQ